MSVTDWAGRRLDIDRQPELGPAMRKRLAAALVQSHSTRAVGRFLGVSHTTVRKWAAQAEAEARSPGRGR